ncbi:hypothetical protein [Rariglobus hedericola]|uniref:Protein translocase subunit SecA n=1 Tax=Rariglobus hedericola TaxID=2597822 RepID=A0A556QIT4_9BACT|nr:hypothetical protein [Rariglobus hedericola]TSJ76550.1 hypothetical protein FPL22_10485 [Rariglobus hedericola]
MSAPLTEVRRTEVPILENLPTGLDAWVHQTHGRWRRRASVAADLKEQAFRIHVEAEKLRGLSESELATQLNGHRENVRRYGLGERWADVFAAALPFVAEYAYRSLGLRPYPVQLMGALGIARGHLVEMATGEGKTLTIALAAAVCGWQGRTVHVITANDYLAGRDASGLRGFYAHCGLEVAAVTAELDPAARRSAYQAEIVYTTGKELVADFLRDRLVLGSLAEPERRMVGRLVHQPGATENQVVLRGLHTAIVDEADNQLIDEAVTPLIISRPQANAELIAVMTSADRFASGLLEGDHYEIDQRFKDVRINEEGRALVSEWCAQQANGPFQRAVWMEGLVNQALQARHFFLRDRQYVVVKGEIVIVDESTGRMMPGRSWRLGLHQAVQAKEGVEITQPSETMARLSFQRFYRLFKRLSGITGTAFEGAGEFWRVYGLPILSVPPHRPNRRHMWAPRYFNTAAEKWAAIVSEVADLHEQGRPVLIGTRSVASSEHLGALLSARGLHFSLLNANRHSEEAAIINLAGDAGVITVATNMAGRGTDIRLGGGVAAAGGLHVILTEAHESGRIDRQLCGRAGRQGDPGSTRLFASLEDDLAERFLSSWERKILDLGIRKAGNRQSYWIGWAIRRAQKSAESQSYRQRRLVMAQDQQLSEALIPSQTIDQI